MQKREKRCLMAEKDSEVIREDGIILVGENEEYVRSLAKKQLEGLGYKIILASDGVAAVDMYKKDMKEIDLLYWI